MLARSLKQLGDVSHEWVDSKGHGIILKKAIPYSTFDDYNDIILETIDRSVERQVGNFHTSVEAYRESYSGAPNGYGAILVVFNGRET